MFQRPRQHINRFRVLPQVDMLVRRVVEGRVAGAIDQGRALPDRGDDVQIGGAGLVDESGRAARGADPVQESAHQG